MEGLRHRLALNTVSSYTPLGFFLLVMQPLMTLND